MSNPVTIAPYAIHSAAAKGIARAGGFVINNLKDIPKESTIFAWGIGYTAIPNYYKILNKREDVSKQICRSVEKTGDYSTAMSWVFNGDIVWGKRSPGKELIPSKDILNFSLSPPWTKYKKSDVQFRVHVFEGKVLGVYYMTPVLELPDGTSLKGRKFNDKIKSYRTGYDYEVYTARVPDDVIEQAILCINSCNETYGAVDVLYNSSEDAGYVLQYTKQPILDEHLMKAYANEIRILADAKSAGQ